MKKNAKYWNYATIAAVLIGICNVLPNYADALFATTFFSSFSLLWKLATSLLILMIVGKKIVAEEATPLEGYSYGKSFGWCYLSSILAGIVEGFLTVLYAKVVVPDYLDKTKNMVMNIISENPAYTPDMISMVEKNVNQVMTPTGLIFSGIIAAVFAGAIMSLIVAAIIKKNPDPMVEE